ncbi:MAG: alpha-glucosidase [Lachnospiraceae bacterium]|nr:alpha-glucosidase [Lachnospiraceae bacterium]
MSNISLNSKIKDLYDAPIGRDLCDKLLMQFGMSSRILTNPIVGNIKIKTLAKIAGSKFDTSVVDAIISLVNSEMDEPVKFEGVPEESWWKDAVFYQIYPRSFYDTNGDGIGDLKGIISKLDYLKELGIDCLWLSPIYDSPNDDNGYDIRDYRKIMSEFGTMEDFDELLFETHNRGMKLIMDLVVNHTSDEHEWFKKAVSGDPKYHDYYIFRKGSEDKLPNNWRSFFAGPAWNYYDNLGEWGLHLFSKKQMDLNWDNEDVRNEVKDLVNWWLDKGVDGFRMDVINCISKPSDLPDGNETVGEMVGIRGIEKYFYGPKLHEYLREIKKESFLPHKAFSVGETPGLGMEMAKLTTAKERGELDMIFSFDHLESPGHTRMEDYEYDLNYLRDYFIKWMTNYGDNCRMSLFFNNHDNPRMTSKITKNKEYHFAVQKLLAVMQFTLKGTPFVFQGDEMGLVNYDFSSMDEIEDVESKGFYKEYLERMTEKEAFDVIVSGTREHARILLPWNEASNNRPQLIKQQTINENVLNVYKELIEIRKRSHTLKYGEFSVLNSKKGRFVYLRKDKMTDVCDEAVDYTYLVDINLSDKMTGAYKTEGYELVFPKSVENAGKLNPYEARIWRRK